MSPLALVALLHLAPAAEPLTLDDALALAARRNADLQAARADEEVAASDARVSYQGVLPRLDLSLALGHQFEGPQQQVQVVPNPDGTNNPPYVRTVINYPSNDFGAHQLSLTFNWTLFDGLASWERISAARTRQGAARRDVDEAALRLAFEVIRRYYAVVREQEALQVRRDAAALSAELVKRADALFAAGRATRADTYSTRASLGSDELAVQAQTASLARARADLGQVLGLGAEAGVEVVPPATVTSPSPDTAPPAPLPDLVTRARQARPLLASRRLAVEAASSDVSRARGAWWPVIGAQATYQKASPDLTGTNGVFGDPGKDYVATVQATLSWNLFAGGETREGVRRAEALARRAIAQQHSAEEQVAAEIAAAREQVVASAASVAPSRETLDAADKALRFAREQLEHGLATQLEVRDAAIRRAQARLAAVGVLVDLAVARADLHRAVGAAQ